MSEDPLFVFVGGYESVDDAKADLEELKELHSERFVGTYDAAVLTKSEMKKEVRADAREIERAIDSE